MTLGTSHGQSCPRAQVWRGLLAGAALLLLAGPAMAQAIIDNGVIQLGVTLEGDLNVPGTVPSSGTGSLFVGLRYLPTGADAISPGCLCEGWGVGDTLSGVSGSVNAAVDGINNVAPISFSSSIDTATSVVQIGSTFRVTHEYSPSASPNLYQVRVTLENISTQPVNPIYRRLMDWDVEPTAFSEYVTVQIGNAANLTFTSDDGFAFADPLTGPSSFFFSGEVVDFGPEDLGALFDFTFAPLDPGQAVSFLTLYGAAGSEAEAVDALTTVQAEAFSLAKPSSAGGLTEGIPNTFIFAFAEVGGDPIFTPPPDPGPGTSTCVGLPLGVANTFDLFILGDLDQFDTDTEGRVAAGGDVDFFNYGIGLLAQPGVDNLVVAGNLNYTNGEIFNGNLAHAATANLTSVTLANGTIRQDTPIDFVAEGAFLRARSAAWSTLEPNGTTTVLDFGGPTVEIRLEGSDPELNIFTLSGTDLNRAHFFSITSPEGSSVLVNIDGVSNQIKNFAFGYTGVIREDITFNLFETTLLDISGIGLQSTILAPLADILFNNAQINGIMIGASLTGNGQVHAVGFEGCLPEV